MGLTTPAWNINNTVVNGSNNTEHFSCVSKFNTLNFLTVIIAMFGLAGNAIVLWLLAFHLPRNAFSVYVCNLACADFLQLCTQILGSLECFLQLNRRHTFFLTVVFMFAYLAGLCMIAAISVERSLSVMWPIWYHCQRPRHTSSIMCALLWAFCLLLNFLLGEGCGLLFSDPKYYFCITCALITTALIILLTVVPSVSSLALLVKMICGSHRIPVTRFYVTIALTLVVFIFLGLPFGIYSSFLIMFKEFQSIFSYHVLEVTIFLSCVNSCANPIIYFLVGSIRQHRLQWQSLKLLLQRAMQDTPEEDSGERVPSQRSGELESV
ncbi:mas-related G-protein coupled receptor member B5 [Mus musculus]|uniref:Mas-related G-protein coupled receptor member B5 n=2 Tax=Mus musculus TaxID=10090 RepID=MRGB5_MOUSE|nr:mas-related G-protein coupled receptor member B5 [Mus musculus]Q91ZB9.1 RecName: Full=Mas-related G-protein coupled receptor member B5 [Mus musculus]AAI20850.1 MAS-related GPR, member B5 [Mus musculus]AAI32004.1 MAS-related GPR, member B5 [Mus musculus]AAK91799.1 G protein-coupled receptor [Mus musculus]CDG86228.1 TPA: Mas-related G protein-coupled receptor g11 [Mus musculus]|eukprot:NP_997421.1 mas-related G-protein coupled receptor member B5 [Mus musculus]